jgi:hypothetical protein
VLLEKVARAGVHPCDGLLPVIAGKDVTQRFRHIIKAVGDCPEKQDPMGIRLVMKFLANVVDGHGAKPPLALASQVLVTVTTGWGRPELDTLVHRVHVFDMVMHGITPMLRGFVSGT